MLSNDLISMRAVEPHDVDRLFLWENSADAWMAGNMAAPYSRQQLWDYANAYDADPFSAKQLRLMVEAGGEAVGAVDLYDFSPRNRHAFVGILIDRACRGKGYAESALALTERYAAAVLGIHSLCATVAAGNAASCALFEGAGYRRVGTLTQWMATAATSFADVHIFQKII